MESQFTNRMTLVIAIFVVGATIALLIHTPNFSAGLCLLSGGYAALSILRDYGWKLDLRRKPGTLFVLMQLVLALIVCIWSESFFAQIYLMILIGEFTFYHARTHSIIFTVGTYIAILMGVMVYRGFPPLNEVYLLFPRVIDFFAIFAMSLLARIAFQQRSRLAFDNEQLRIASIELEQKAKLQERTRISREIHDSVGHTLTSVLTGLQTAELAIRKNKFELASEMIARTNDSVRRGLNDVRTSVHLLREPLSGASFIPEIAGLIRETSLQTGVDIAYTLDPNLPELPPKAELAVYRALQEGLTNGIRHGGSTKFDFSLAHRDGRLWFELSNNGRPPAQLMPGFGLSAMKERVEDAGGQLRIASGGSEDGGVTLLIEIPLTETGRPAEGFE